MPNHGFNSRDDVRRVIAAARRTEVDRVSDSEPAGVFRQADQIVWVTILDAHPTYPNTYRAYLKYWFNTDYATPNLELRDADPTAVRRIVYVQGANNEALIPNRNYAVVGVESFFAPDEDDPSAVNTNGSRTQQVVYKAVGTAADYYGYYANRTGGCTTRVTLVDRRYTCGQYGGLKESKFTITFGVCGPVVVAAASPSLPAIPVVVPAGCPPLE